MSTQIALLGNAPGGLAPGDAAPPALAGYDGIRLTSGPTPSPEQADAAHRAALWAVEQQVPFLAAATHPAAARAETDLTVVGWRFAPVPGGRHLVGHPFFVLTDGEPGAEAVAHFEQWAGERAARRAASAAEALPRTYTQQMRGGRYRPWKPLVALVAALAGWLVLNLVLVVAFLASGQLDSSALESGAFAPTAWNNLFLNLSLAVLIPVCLGVSWLVYRRGWQRVLSVTGRVRWGWMLRAHLVLLPLWLAVLGAGWMLFGGEVTARPTDWVALGVVTLLTTPLQSAAEEIGFRGLMAQAVGAWFRHPVVSAVVAAVVSVVAFALAHGSLDPWILIDLGAFAAAASWLAWRTGGLEAAIAIHVVNNLLVTGQGIVFGGLEKAYVSTESTSTPASAAFSVLSMVLAAALLDWQAGRAGVRGPGRAGPLLG